MADRETPFCDPGRRMLGIWDLIRAVGAEDGSYVASLLRLIAKATPQHRARLAAVYPGAVMAYETWGAWTPAPTAYQFRQALGIAWPGWLSDLLDETPEGIGNSDAFARAEAEAVASFRALMKSRRADMTEVSDATPVDP